MASKVTIQNGQFQNPDGSAVSGYLVLQLSSPAAVVGTGEIVPSQITIAVTNGNAVATALWGNDNLTPNGTTYRAILADSGHNQIANFGNWSFAGAGPIELNNMVPTSTGASYPAPVLQIPSSDQTISNSNLLPAVGNTSQSLGSASAPWNAELRSQNGILFADAFPGADIFAKANAAAASLSGPGVVVIPPGSYSSVTTTLNCLTDVEFRCSGVSVGYTGSGAAISCQSVSRAKVTGPMHLTSNKTAATYGIYLGNPTANVNLTTECVFEDITIGDTPGLSSGNGFNIGIMIDGNLNSGTYYNHFRRVSSNGNLSHGWLIKPTLSARANSNRFDACTAAHNGGDGFQIDGANFNTFTGIDSEDNGAYGVNLAGTQTTNNNSFFGGDLEGNATADWNFTSASVNWTFIFGVNCSSTTLFAGDPFNGNNNQFWGGSALTELSFAQGTRVDWPLGSPNGTSTPPLNIRDTENGGAKVLAVQRTGTGTGEVNVGTDQYPLTVAGTAVFGGALEINGATPTGSGSQLGIGNTTGFGNGSSGTAVTTTTKNTGSGPTTPQTIVEYLQIDRGGTKYWVPLVQ